MKCPNCGNETDDIICPLCGFDTEKFPKKLREAFTETPAEKKAFHELILKDLSEERYLKQKKEILILKYFLNATLYSKEAFEIIKSLDNKMGKGDDFVSFSIPTTHINPMSGKEIKDYIDKLLERYLEKSI